MIRTGVQRAYGAGLQRVLGANLGHPLKALLAGLGVTMLLQSSTATGPMATSFAAGGLVELVPALAVMIGANVGTALIGEALSFDGARAAPVLILIGAVAFRHVGGSPSASASCCSPCGAILAWAAHSSVAVVLLVAARTPHP